MAGNLLYSTNVALKFHIQQKYRGDVHYVWCSEHFDSKALGLYSGLGTPPSSNPSDIYAELHKAVKGRDKHCAKIEEQKLRLRELTAGWLASGEIGDIQAKEIIHMTTYADFHEWRPLLYVIPIEAVRLRIEAVPIDKRAGFGDEWTISDLQRNEFDLIEFICP